MINDIILSEIRNNVTFYDIAKHFNLSIENKKIICPIHNDSTPSMSIYNDNAHCFVCNKSVSIFMFVQYYLDISFVDAVKYINQVFNLNLNLKEYDNKTLSWIKEIRNFEKEQKLELKTLRQYYIELINEFDRFLNIHYELGYYKKMYKHHIPKNELVFSDINSKDFFAGIIKNYEYLKKTEQFLKNKWILPDKEEIKTKILDGIAFKNACYHIDELFGSNTL